jgi:hypothetical protein
MHTDCENVADSGAKYPTLLTTFIGPAEYNFPACLQKNEILSPQAANGIIVSLYSSDLIEMSRNVS